MSHPNSHEKPTFAADFKRFFVRGLAILLPSILTLWIVWQAYLFLDRQVAEPINSGIRRGVLWVIPRTFEDKNLPSWFVVNDDQVKEFRVLLQRQGTLDAQTLLQLPDPALREDLRALKFKRFWDAHWYFRFIGLIVAVTLIYLAGRMLGGFIGRSVYARLEKMLTRIPVIKQVYPHVKQVVEMIFGEKQIAFKKVVLVEYPRKGIWTIGFVTSSGMRSVADAAGEQAITVFIPSTPTPFTGFTISVPRSQALELAITVDEALRFVLTGGVLVPTRQSADAADTIAEGDGDVGARGMPGGQGGDAHETGIDVPQALPGGTGPRRV